jgi:phosphoenolpyruvate carboxylase
VQDEHHHVGFYLANPIYRIVPAFYESLADALQTVYGVACRCRNCSSFATWVGGDMDGNPNVGADTIAASLATQRAHVLEHYIADVDDSLACSARPRIACEVDEACSSVWTITASAFRGRSKHSPASRGHAVSQPADPDGRALEATEEGHPEGYTSAAELLDDLQLIVHSLSIITACMPALTRCSV